MLRIVPGSSELDFNVVGINADQVERLLTVLTEAERAALGKDPGTSVALAQISKQLKVNADSRKIATDLPPAGTAAPPQNG